MQAPVARCWARRTGPLHSSAAKLDDLCEKSIGEDLFWALDWDLHRGRLQLVFSPASIFPRSGPPALGPRVRGFDARRSSRNRMTTLIWIKVAGRARGTVTRTVDLDNRRRCDLNQHVQLRHWRSRCIAVESDRVTSGDHQGNERRRGARHRTSYRNPKSTSGSGRTPWQRR